MKMRYFEDTDTLYIELTKTRVVESRDFDENTVMDVDLNGDVVAITVEHASSPVW
jgi:uncharacterized protein YuzE